MTGADVASIGLMAVGLGTYGALYENGHQGGALDTLGVTGAMTNWSVAPVIQMGGAYNINVGESILFGVGSLLIVIGMYAHTPLTIFGAIVGAFLIADATIRYFTGSDIP